MASQNAGLHWDPRRQRLGHRNLLEVIGHGKVDRRPAFH
jgi:hypothetical protein